MSRENKCQACLQPIEELSGTCLYCGSDKDAVQYLDAVGLDAWGVYEILKGRVNFFRLTLACAKTVATILRTSDDKPN